MAVMAGDLVTRLGVDGRKFQSGLDKARGQTRSFASDVTSIVSGIAIADIGKRAIGGIVDLSASVVKLAADAQTAQITFEVLTGDAAKGAKLFKDIQKFASRTSFDLTSAADATKSLLAAGVGDSDVMGTMQLLGDLAMGDANKLGFLSKAYTDVMNKGKLQGQEIRQFAENGVGLVGALASSMNKTNAEILKMSEAGQISFADMKKALEALTGPGGRFFGMMARINETFTGQWNSLVENIQTFGRDLGALVLPKLTAIVAETNKLLTAFNSLGDARWKFAGELVVASFDVAMETIKLHWAEMLNNMLDQVSKIDWSKLLNPFASVKISDLRPSTKPENLQEAQGRLNGLMGKLRDAGGGAAAANADPMQAAKDAASAALKAYDAASAKRKQFGDATVIANQDRESKSDAFLRALDDPNLTVGRMEALKQESNAALAAYDRAAAVFDDALTAETNARVGYEQAEASLAALEQAKGKETSQDAFTSGISSMFEKLKSSPLMGTIDSLKMGAGGMIDRAKIQAGAIAGTFSNMFGADKTEQTKAEQSGPSFANAMQKGSQEAFSTILNDVLGVRQDPLLKATKEQTKQIVAALTKQKSSVQPKFAPEFA